MTDSYKASIMSVICKTIGTIVKEQVDSLQAESQLIRSINLVEQSYNQCNGDEVKRVKIFKIFEPS